jgi:hypothetical protein
MSTPLVAAPESRYLAGRPGQPNQESHLPRANFQHLPTQGQGLGQYELNGCWQIVPKPAQPRLAFQDLPSVRERFRIGRWSFHRAIGYQLTRLMLRPCQAHAFLANFNVFTFRNSVLGLMPSSFAAF